MTKIKRRGAVCVMAAALLMLVCEPAFAGNTEKRIQAAIDKIRDIHIETLSETEGRKVERTLEKTLNVLEKHPVIAREQIRKVLAEEFEDSFLLIELSQILTLLFPDEETLVEVAPWMERADPTAFPNGFFQVASFMAASRCEPCMPVALGILRFETLSASIEEHALPVDLDLGMLFVLGPYGEEIESLLRSKLIEGPCVEQRNAARSLRLLVPISFPKELVTVVSGDSCEEAKVEAWGTIGFLGHPELGELVSKRISEPASPSVQELLAIVAGLGKVYFSHVYDDLEDLSGSGEVEVARAAADMRTSLQAQEEETQELLQNVGSANADAKREMRENLQQAVESAAFDFTGSAKELEALVDASDLGLLNSARASILRRRSDECLYEFRKLHLAAMLARQLGNNQPSVP